jgi:hypothetical protein
MKRSAIEGDRNVRLRIRTTVPEYAALLPGYLI